MLPIHPLPRRVRHCFRDNAMNCAESEVLLHALIDGELDAGHAHEVEAHAAACSACAEQLASFRVMREAMAGAALQEIAPAQLRSRVEASLAVPASRIVSMRSFFRPTRRSFFGGFAAGSVPSAAVAATLFLPAAPHHPGPTI